MRNNKVILSFIFIIGLISHYNAQEEMPESKIEWFGYMGGEFRYFPDEPLYAHQKDTYFSAVFRPQFLYESSNKMHQINFTGFVRLDQYDHQRTHWDIRDLYWRYAKDSWEINAGIKTVMWGKTESNHLVDIINQYDLVEGRTLEHKLGQPMIQAVFAPSWGSIEFLLMTYARELEFPGAKGRLRPGYEIYYDYSIFEKKNSKYLPDLAVRFSKYVGELDFAVSYFYGTNRLPLFLPTPENGMIPYYQEIHQSGLELQWLKGPFAFRFEGIHQRSNRQNINAYTVGGEYNFYFITGPELKSIIEYNYDERGKEQITGLENDLFLGLNLFLNDIQSTSIMSAIIRDLDHGSTILRLQAERRIGNSWKLSVLYNGIENTSPEDFYHLIRNDSFLEVGILYYF